MCLILWQQFESRQVGGWTMLSEKHLASIHALLLSDLNVCVLVKVDALLHRRGQKVVLQDGALTAGVINKVCVWQQCCFGTPTRLTLVP